MGRKGNKKKTTFQLEDADKSKKASNGDLVLANPEAENEPEKDQEQVEPQKRKRGISTVSMQSDEGGNSAVCTECS